MKQHEEIADLAKDSEVYLAHEAAIDEIRNMLVGCNSLIWRTLQHAQERSGTLSQKVPSPKFIDDKSTHINCTGLQILAHRIGMEAFRQDRDDHEAAELRLPLQHIIAVRASILQFTRRKQPFNLVGTVQQIDESIGNLAPEAEVPALTPYMFKPQTTISQLKVLAQGKKFADADLLLNIHALFREDHHILHSVCMSLIENGMHEEVGNILLLRAKEVFPGFGPAALTPLFQENHDLFVVYMIALTESGKTEDVIKWCKRPHFAKLLTTNEKVAEKYVASLRHQGRFEEALMFLEELRDQHGLSTKALSAQYTLAQRKDTTILLRRAGE